MVTTDRAHRAKQASRPQTWISSCPEEAFPSAGARPCASQRSHPPSNRSALLAAPLPPTKMRALHESRRLRSMPGRDSEVVRLSCVLGRSRSKSNGFCTPTLLARLAQNGGTSQPWTESVGGAWTDNLRTRVGLSVICDSPPPPHAHRSAAGAHTHLTNERSETQERGWPVSTDLPNGLKRFLRLRHFRASSHHRCCASPRRATHTRINICG